MTVLSGDAPFRADVIDLNALSLVGELDESTVPVLMCAAELLCHLTDSSDDGVLYIDVSGLTFLGAAGLNAFVTMRMDLLADGRRLVWRGMPTRMRRLFALGGVAWLLDAAEDEDVAARHLGSTG